METTHRAVELRKQLLPNSAVYPYTYPAPPFDPAN